MTWKNHTFSHQSKAGKAGFKATVEKYGKDFATKKAADWRRDHPSCLERVVIGWLDEIQVNYTREVPIDRFFVDFLIDNLVVEVNGQIWHTDNELTNNNATKHDAGKYKTLASLGYTVLVLPEQNIVSGQARKKLENILRS